MYVLLIISQEMLSEYEWWIINFIEYHRKKLAKFKGTEIRMVS